MSKKYRLATLGCRTNQYESQAYAAQLESLGYTLASEGESADLCIVNTCTVTQSAHADSRQVIRRLKRENPGARVVATGCAIEGRTGLKLDVEVVPNKAKEELIQRIFPGLESYPEFSIKRFEAHTRAFVKVQDGCNSFCSYCIIPYVRGRSRSRPIDEILAEVEQLVANGYKEIVLTGINIGDFEFGLAKLVRLIDEIDGVERIRISSIDPDEVDDDLLRAVVDGKKTCPSMHIVLQAGSNVVLTRMNRKYTRQIFLETVDRLKQADPNFTFTTDIIVGFPGETERDFEETVEVMQEVQFAKVHMFPYSDRERTKAASFPNKVGDEEKKRRKRRLMTLAEEGAFSLRDHYVGRTMSVLAETNASGHTDNFLRVILPNARPNSLVEVELVENGPDGLVGRVVDAHLNRRSA